MIQTRTLIPLSVPLIVFAVFVPALSNDFISWDDNLYVYENPNIRSLDLKFLRWAMTDQKIDYWQPVSWLSHAVAYTLWGLNPAGHHLVNIILHAMNAFLLTLLTMTLLRAALDKNVFKDRRSPVSNEYWVLIGGCVTGLFFGLHPLRVESVAWVTERKDLLCGFFYLLSVRSYLRYDTGQGQAGYGHRIFGNMFKDRSYVLSLTFFLLALASKPMAVSLPLVLLLLQWYPLKRINTSDELRKALPDKMPFFALCLVISITTLLQQKSIGVIVSLQSVPMFSRVLLACNAVIYYLLKSLVPLGLVPFYPLPKNAALDPIEYLPPVLLTAVITVVCLSYARKQRLPAALWGYYIICLFPVLGIVRAGIISMADRFTYLPAAAPSLLAGVLAASAWSWSSNREKGGPLLRGLMIASAAIIFGGLSFLTIEQTARWKDSLTFWNYVIEKKPHQIAVAYNQRGIVFAEKGDKEKAFSDFSEAITLDPAEPSAYDNRGVLFQEIGRYGDAISDFNRAIALNPSSYSAHDNRGFTYAGMDQPDKAMADFNRAIEINPEFARAYLDRGGLLISLGQTAQAEADFRTACDLGSEAGCRALSTHGGR